MGCSPKRFSRPPRCDRFDTPPCPSIISVFYAPVNRLIRARLRFVLRRAFPLFSALFCRRRYAAMLLLAFCRLPCLYPIFCPLLSSPICRNAFARALLFVASSPRPFRFLSPPCAEVFSLALRFVPPLLAAFSRARARARFAVRALTANRSALKKPPR